jgi:hypothetical protein
MPFRQPPRHAKGSLQGSLLVIGSETLAIPLDRLRTPAPPENEGERVSQDTIKFGIAKALQFLSRAMQDGVTSDPGAYGPPCDLLLQ